MTPLTRSALVFALIAPLFGPSLSAQNFGGSDDFSTDDASHWGTETHQNGAFSVAFGQLHFTDGGLATGSDSFALRPWILNTGSALADWYVQMDFTLNTTLVPGQFVGWSLQMAHGDNPGDYLELELVQSYMFERPRITGSLVTNHNFGPTDHFDLPSGNTATLRIAFEATSQTLSAAYDANGSTGGYAFNTLFSTPLNTGETDWDLVAGSRFELTLSAENFANAGPSSPLVQGAFSADNFLAGGGTPVPEPVTAGLLVGLGALAVAAHRRRTRR